MYLRQNATPKDNKSLTLISSVSGVICPPDTPFYNVRIILYCSNCVNFENKASKSAVLGLARSLAQRLPASHNIRVNVVCPSLTRTPLASMHVLPFFEKHKLPINEPMDIADSVLFLASAPECNRKILWVEGAKSWDIEDPLLRLMPEWVGEGPWSIMETVQRLRDSSA